MELFIPRIKSHAKLLVEYYNRNKEYIKECIKAMKKWVDRTGFSPPEGGLLIGWGYSKPPGKNPDFSTLEPIFLDEEARKRNVIVFGTIGSGKTYLAMAMAHYDILEGKPLIFIDPKPSLETLNAIVYATLEAGRLQDFKFFTMVYPSVSYRVNPLSRYFLPNEMVEHLTRGLLVKDQFFIEVSIELTTVIVLILYFKKLVGRSGEQITIGDIIRYMRRENFSKLADEFSEVQEEIRRRRKDLIPYLQSLENLIELIKASPPEYFSKVTTTLRVHLGQMSVGIMGRLLTSDTEESFVADIEAGDAPIVFAQVPALLDSRIVKKLSRTLISMVTTLAGRLLVAKRRPVKPVSVIVDEFSNAVHVGFDEAINKVREAGIQFTVLTQTLSDLYVEVGKDLAHKILGNFNTLICMSTPDPEAARYVAQRFGTDKSYELIMRNLEEPTMREVEKPVIEPGMVMDMPARHFYYKNYQGIFYGKTADYYVPPVEVEGDVPVGIR